MMCVFEMTFAMSPFVLALAMCKQFVGITTRRQNIAGHSILAAVMEIKTTSPADKCV
jgi:hypothetical protein